MNAELLLEHFHRLGDAPDAVPRLRRFILDLAVRGKLVEQDEADEAATSLLKRLGIPSVNEAAVFELPNNWAWIQCSSLMHERAETINPLHHPDEEFVLWSVPSFSTGKPEVVLGRNIGASKPAIEPGVILISRINPHLNRVWVTQAIPGYRHIASSEWIVLKPTGLLPDYLMWSLRSPFFFEQFCSVLTGIGGSLTRVRPSDAAQYLLPIPPLPEQHRIVAKVEELMALCDRLEAAQQQREAERTRLTAAVWQAVVQAEAPADVSFALEQLPALTTRPAQVKALRQTILDLAVRGRLVEQDAKDEPAEVLLERMSVERTGLVAKREFKKTQPLPPVTSDEQDFKAPKGWAWTRFGVIGDWGSGSTPSRSISEYYNGTHTWLKSGELNDVIGLTGSEEKVTDRALKECSFRLNRKGDVLIAMYGATIGKLAILGEDAVTNQAVCGCTVLSGMSNRYLFLQLLAMRSAFHGQSEGGAQPNISKEKIINTPFPLPPLVEQKRIVTKVEELMALCDGLEGTLAASETLRGKVLEAVVRSETGGTEPPAPVRVRQLPVPKVRAPRYEEAEVELAVAAEPVGHTGAMQAVVRRGPIRIGPGRPPKSGALTSTAERAIEAYLKAHPGWHGKAAILEATGVDAGAWNAAIKELLEGGKVERQGEKKGARYRGR